jgi:hypothetical protein
MVDPHDQMETTRPKWSKIANELNLNGFTFAKEWHGFQGQVGMHVW